MLLDDVAAAAAAAVVGKSSLEVSSQIDVAGQCSTAVLKRFLFFGNSRLDAVG